MSLQGKPSQLILEATTMPIREADSFVAGVAGDVLSYVAAAQVVMGIQMA